MKSIIFMGTPQFSAPILESLIANKEYNVIAVVTQPDRRVGRKHLIKYSPVKEVALKNDIPVLQPEKLSGSEELSQLIDLHPDLIVTAAFGQFLPMSLINSAKIGAINVHASLLPKYRGGAPVHYAILKGDRKTGVSIIYMVKKMDAGDILSQREIPIENDDTVGSMFDKLSILGRDLLLNTMPKLIAGDIKPIKQDEEQVTFSPNISPEQEQVNINLSSFLFDAKVRGLCPFPVAYVMLNGKRTKLWKTHVVDEKTDENPGVVVERNKHHLLVATGEHGIVSLDEIQPAGKQKMKITDFLNGIGSQIKVGDQIIKYEE